MGDQFSPSMSQTLQCLLLLCCTGAVFAAQKDMEHYTFDAFISEFRKSYSPAEHAQRKSIFETRLASIRNHNANPESSYKLGVNAFSDMHESERRIRGIDKALLHHQRLSVPAAPAPRDLSHLPSSVDWRKHEPNVISAVKNQGVCGSCWTFASAETVESHWALKTGHLEALSEQFILDCIPNPDQCGGTGGCGGGTSALAFEGLSKHGGIPSEWTYAYVSGLGGNQTCRAPSQIPAQQPHSGSIMLAANVTGHVSLPTNSYSAMLEAVATKGPITITVDAGGWHDYATGIFDGGNHTNPDLDHLVQLMGYGSEGGKDYWIIRNSWTPEWGEDGYIRVARHSQDAAPCGMDITPADGDGCKGGPTAVKVCGVSGVLYDGAYPILGVF